MRIRQLRTFTQALTLGIHIVHTMCGKKHLPRFLLCSLILSPTLLAEEATLAVASNFVGPLKTLLSEFESDTGHSFKVVSGSSGKLASQIQQGAPFDLFFSADQEKPRVLLKSGHAVQGTLRTYATGALAFWVPGAKKVTGPQSYLLAKTTSQIAIANPRLAPYGQAAKETLDHIGLATFVGPKLLTGENISQAYEFIRGGADCGFIALSQVINNKDITEGEYWQVPRTMHKPILQDMILLAPGKDNAAARALLEYMILPSTQETLSELGYRKRPKVL